MYIYIDNLKGTISMRILNMQNCKTILDALQFSYLRFKYFSVGMPWDYIPVNINRSLVFTHVDMFGYRIFKYRQAVFIRVNSSELKLSFSDCCRLQNPLSDNLHKLCIYTFILNICTAFVSPQMLICMCSHNY